MKCPNCLTVMRCITEIHNVPGHPGRQRMDLHCVKPIHIEGTDRMGRGCDAACHMGVITEDPKEWVCHDYNFSFSHDHKSYILRGYDYLVNPSYQHRPYEKATVLLVNNFPQSDIIKIDFVPLSTGDDMHEWAWELFHRLRNLIIFS